MNLLYSVIRHLEKLSVFTDEETFGVGSKVLSLTHPEYIRATSDVKFIEMFNKKECRYRFLTEKWYFDISRRNFVTLYFTQKKTLRFRTNWKSKNKTKDNQLLVFYLLINFTFLILIIVSSHPTCILSLFLLGHLVNSSTSRFHFSSIISNRVSRSFRHESNSPFP